MKMARYWINQPSTLQPAHSMHGQNVLAPRELSGDAKGTVTVYFITGAVISADVFVDALSTGWIRNEK